MLVTGIQMRFEALHGDVSIIYTWFAVILCLYPLARQIMFFGNPSCFIFYYRRVDFQNSGDFSVLLLTTIWAEGRTSFLTALPWSAFLIFLNVSTSLPKCLVNTFLLHNLGVQLMQRDIKKKSVTSSDITRSASLQHLLQRVRPSYSDLKLQFVFKGFRSRGNESSRGRED